MKRIAVIGSGSFLARNFIKYAVDHHFDYSFELYDFCDRNEWPQFPYSKINFNDINEVRKIDFSVDTILLYIGKTGTTAGFTNYKEFIEVNEVMLLNILSCYAESGNSARIIYPSSRLVFKSNEHAKIPEDGERECKSIYAVTKLSAENYLHIYRESFSVQSVVLRICTPIGTLLDDCGSYGTFEIFRQQAIKNREITVFGDGLQRKTFTHISDICKAFSAVIDKESLKYDAYNLGGNDYSLIEIADKIASEYSVPVKHTPWPKMYQAVDGGSVVFDSSRFDSEFNMTYEPLL